jgi:hypothetical protein
MSLANLPILQAHQSKMTKSILHSLLWLTGIVWMGSLGAMPFVPTWLQVCLVAGMAITLAAPLAAFCYFAVRDPDRLHSEQHRETMRHYDLLGDDRKTPISIIEQLPPVPNTAIGQAIQPAINAPENERRMAENRYVLIVDAGDKRANYAAIGQYLRDSVWIAGWANHLPFMFLLKSDLEIGALTDKLHAVVAPVKYMLFKIHQTQTTGLMPQPTWDWINEVPPPKPAGLLSLSDYMVPQPGQTFSYASLLAPGLLDPPGTKKK